MADVYSAEELAEIQKQHDANRLAFRESISTPEGYAKDQAYVADMMAKGSEMQGGESWFQGFLGKFIETVPYIYIAAATMGAAGAFGGAAAGSTAAGGMTAAEMMAASSAGMASGVGAVGTGAAGAAAGVGAGLAGIAAGTAGGLGGSTAGTTLGTTMGAEGIPQVIIPGTAPAAGPGLGTLAAGAGLTGAGLATMGGSGTIPPENIVQVPGQRPPPDNIFMPPMTVPTQTNIPPPNIERPIYQDPGTPVPLPPIIPLGGLSSPTSPSGTGAGTTPTGTGGVPSGWTDLIGGLTGILSGNVDRINSEQDSEWWLSQINSLMGMYKPGTPEAELMRQKMEARDAASGRRSQYGQRSVELATNLADKRANIMTSAGYQNMANAYRKRSSESLNGLFGAAGNNNVSQIISGLGSLFRS